MYAVIKTGGKQYRVEQGDKLKIESLNGEIGDSLQFDEVMMLADGEQVNVGAPLVSGAAVAATIVSQGRHAKVEIIKFRRRKHHQKRTGHRQNFTEVEITDILADGAKPKAKPAAKKAAPKPAPTKEEVKQEEKAPAPKKEAAPKPAKEAAPAAAPKFMDGPDGEPDDLKKIKGVGPVLEKKLNEMGIYHYRQVVALTADQIEAVENHAGFPGRIGRDEWLKQAAELDKG